MALIVARLKRDAEREAERIVRELLLTEPSEATLDHRAAFVGDDQLVMVVEGEGAETAVRALLDDEAAFGEGGRLRALLEAPPSVLQEIVSWSRPVPQDGVTYTAQPGPGDSDGGG